jgi:hypothetical protein
MEAFDESRAKQALVRVRGKGTTGTGFFFDEDGLVMTCHHVVDGADSITVEDATGNVAAATLVEAMSVPDLDVAILRVSARAPAVLALGAAPAPPENVWTSGYQFQSGNVRAPLPSIVRIDGTTDIAYLYRRPYAMRQVLRLSDGLISSGLSGAPVIALPEGVAIGVATADFDKGGGFAVPISRVLEQSDALRTHALRLEARVPAFGRYLNTSAARSICAAQVEQTVGHMSELGQFLPDRYVKRRTLYEALDAFRQSRTRIFPVIGVSGIGKTTALAGAARSSSPSIFVPAYRAKFGDGGLAATIASELARSSSRAVDAERLVDSLARGGSQLTVIIDGLNEATALTTAAGRAWLDDTIEWLKTRPVRLVITSRIEFWSLIADLFPSNLLFAWNVAAEDDERPKNSTFELRQFDDVEVHDAATAYELSADAAEDTALRNPLLVRLYWELGARGARVGMYALFERFTEDRAKKISRAMGGTTSAGTVRHALGVAARLADSATLAIPSEKLIEALLPLNDVREALVTENILVESANGYRFIFDELADFLRYEGRELPHSQEEWQQLLQSEERSGSTRFALLKLEQTQPAELPRQLQSVITAFEHDPDWELALLVQQVITAADNPTPLIPVVLELAAAVARARVWYRFLHFPDLVREANLSASERLQVARQFLPSEHYYEWEEKHWRDVSSDVFFYNLVSYRSQGGPAIVAEALLVDYEAAMAILLDWTDDETLLSDNNGHPTSTSRLNDLARAFIFHARRRDFAFVSRMTAERVMAGSSGADSVMRLLAEYDAQELLPFVEEWTAMAQPLHDELVVSALGRMTWPASIDFTDRAEAVLQLVIHRRISERAVAHALSILSRRPQLAASVFDEILWRFMKDDWLISGYTLHPFVVTHFDALLAGLRRYLDEPHPTERKRDALYALSPPGPTTAQLEKFAELLSHVVARHPELSYAVGRAVEDSIDAVETPSAASDALFALARRVLLGSDDGARQAVLYAVCDTRNGPAKTSTQDALIDSLVAGEAPRRLLEMLLNQLAAARHNSDAEMQRIHRLAERLDAAPDGESLIARATPFGGMGPRLAEWLALRPVQPGSPAEQFLRYVRDEHMDPGDAANLVLAT